VAIGGCEVTLWVDTVEKVTNCPSPIFLLEKI
jgi:hypothetical protein